MRKMISGKKGQVLVISIAVIFALFMLVLVTIETGGLVYEKIHMQNIADSAAMEAGLWYARCMNITALSNKVLALAGLAGVIGALFGQPEIFKVAEFIQTGQDALLGTGQLGEKMIINPAPLLAFGAVLRNGHKNGAVSMAFFNIEDFREESLNPSFNVKRNYLDTVFEKAEDRYYYRKKDGTIVEVPAGEVEYNSRIKNRESEKKKVKTRKGSRYGSKFLKTKEVKTHVKGVIPLDIVEKTTDHTVLIISFKKDPRQLLNNGFLSSKEGKPISPSFLASSSLVRVKGGTLDVFDDGAVFVPAIDKVILPEIDASGVDEDMVEAASGYLKEGESSLGKNLGRAVEYISKGTKLLTDNIILH